MKGNTGKKSKGKAQDEGRVESFDHVALTRLTSKINSTLSRPRTVPAASSRKRKWQDHPSDGPEDGPGPKRRHLDPAKPSSTADGARRALMDEILELGGDQDDFELVANIDSDPEDSPDGHVDRAFRDELATFAQSLGFDTMAQDDAPSEAEEPEPETSDHDHDHDEGREDKVEEEAAVSFVPGLLRKERSSEKLVSILLQPLPSPAGTDLLTSRASNQMFEPRPDWHKFDTNEASTSLPPSASNCMSAISPLKDYAQHLLGQDSAAYSTMKASASSHRFRSTIMSSGTLADKVSALTLAVQESPVHTRQSLDALITLAGKKSRGQAVAALGALVDLLGNGMVLPSHRRLHAFTHQPALLSCVGRGAVSKWERGQPLPPGMTRAHLIMWAYEEWLKDAYFRVVQLLEVWSADEVEYARSRAVDFIYGLLKEKPEQEANLLRLLVNKLGDRERKIASRASYLLLQLLTLHPGMKTIIIHAVEHDMLLKPGQDLRCRYYAINTLNQTILSSKEPEIADTLLRIYFDVFVSLLKSDLLGRGLETTTDPEPKTAATKRKRPGKTGAGGSAEATEKAWETCQKLVSALLTGVNRAIPFAAADNPSLDMHLDTLFHITHSSNFNTSVQALVLIQQLASKKHLAVDRFYRTLYESLLDPRLVTSSKQALYLNLLYRSLKNDVDSRRVMAFVKRLVQVLNMHQPPFVCGVLYLIIDLKATFPDLNAMLDTPEEHEEGGNGDAAGHLPGYDGRKRDPKHSNAQHSCLWELVPFLSHFHPSVAVFASHLTVPQKSLPKPELASHMLIHFLDKFVYRNPKTADAKRGSSIMQPIFISGSSARPTSSKAGAQLQPSMNSALFRQLLPEQVAAEDVFFHEYFARAGKPGQVVKHQKAPEDKTSDADEAAEEEEIWKALVRSRPDMEGDPGDEAEDDMDADVEQALEMEDYGDSGSEGDSDSQGADVSGAMHSTSEEGGGGGEDWWEDEEDEDKEDGDEDEQNRAQGREVGRKQGRLSRAEMRGLPTFASAEDYAEILAEEEEDGAGRDYRGRDEA